MIWIACKIIIVKKCFLTKALKMKRILYIIVIILAFSTSLNAQIDEALKKIQLYEGSVYVTYGHRISLMFSEIEFYDDIVVYPKTNIAYYTYQQLIVLAQDTAKREEWNQERYLKSRNYFKEKAKGGRIILYVERYDQYETNNKLFFVIIRDKDDNKIFEYNLPRRPADLVTSDVFSNWAYIDVDIELPEEFYVYVNNKMTERLSDTKFLVETNAAPVVKEPE